TSFDHEKDRRYGRASTDVEDERRVPADIRIETRKGAGMRGSRAGLVLSAITLLVVSLGAQRTSSTNRPLTNAQLQAKVRALEDENAALTRDYDLLLASCRNPAPRDGQPAGSADAVVHDTPGGKETTSAVRRSRNVDDDLFWIVSVNYGVTETTANT